MNGPLRVSGKSRETEAVQFRDFGEGNKGFFDYAPQSGVTIWRLTNERPHAPRSITPSNCARRRPR